MGSGCPLQCVLQCSQSNPRANMEGLQTRGGRKHRYQGLPASELQGQEQEPATQPNARGCRATSSTGGHAAFEDEEHTLLLEALPFHLVLGVGASSSTVNISRSLLCMDLVSDSKASLGWPEYLVAKWQRIDTVYNKIYVAVQWPGRNTPKPKQFTSHTVIKESAVYAEKNVLILRGTTWRRQQSPWLYYMIQPSFQIVRKTRENSHHTTLEAGTLCSWTWAPWRGSWWALHSRSLRGMRRY